MRAIVLVLMLLAFVKIWTQDRLFRSAAEEALITAYRDRAVEACRKGAGKGQSEAWSRWPEMRLEIGRADVAVQIWDTDNALWAMRYKHPVIVLSAAGAAPARCAYDVTLDKAEIKRS